MDVEMKGTPEGDEVCRCGHLRWAHDGAGGKCYFDYGRNETFAIGGHCGGYRRSVTANPPEEITLPRLGFPMDGTIHFPGDRKCAGCAGGDCEDCPCGGLVHEQAVYGPSILYECDKCGLPDGEPR